MIVLMPSETPSNLQCPQCRAPLEAQDAVCPACGANIMLVTLLAESQWLGRAKTGVLGGTGTLTTGNLRPTSIEQLVPRLGDFLLAQGYITEAQLETALNRKREAGNSPRLIGQILVEMGAITRETLDRVIARQIIELQNALLQANRSLERNVAERTAELESAIARLTELNQLKANIVANISHELRTPLTQIKGYNILLAEEALGPITTEQREALTAAALAIERLEKLIVDLISYASAARGEMTLSLRPIKVSDLIEEVIQNMKVMASRKGVVLTSRLAPDLAPVMADADKLKWAMQQLVDNAVKFTPGGGRVTISAAPDSRRVRLSVQDTGIGIAANRLDDIFEDFRQLDGSSTRHFGGTGLGLALVRRIIEAHGARIHVESREGRGSLFAFSLPTANLTTEATAA